VNALRGGSCQAGVRGFCNDGQRGPGRPQRACSQTEEHPWPPRLLTNHTPGTSDYQAPGMYRRHRDRQHEETKGEHAGNVCAGVPQHGQEKGDDGGREDPHRAPDPSHQWQPADTGGKGLQPAVGTLPAPFLRRTLRQADGQEQNRYQSGRHSRLPMLDVGVLEPPGALDTPIPLT
jgi:hypothetical protein